MKERIVQIMEAENLTPSLFADKLNIGRAVVSHILNGRNNPSLDVVIRILDTIDYVDADWLLSGKGSMRKSDNMIAKQPELPTGSVTSPQSLDLFANAIENEAQTTTNRDDYANNDSKASSSFENAIESPIPQEESLPKQVSQIPIIPVTEKKISKVIIYYSDKTFQAFNPDEDGL